MRHFDEEGVTSGSVANITTTPYTMVNGGKTLDDALADAKLDDYADRAISRMRSPRDMHIICVDVTNKCDLHCSNCTRLLKNQTELWDMTPDNFRLALRSLKGFTGVIAMIGGNPCISKHFPDLCRIFAEEIPNKRQRGLWSNNVFEYQELIRDTFGKTEGTVNAGTPLPPPQAQPRERQPVPRRPLSQGASVPRSGDAG